MSRITTPTEDERIWNEACAEARAIEGERNPETGQFEVTKWPKPRVSNPNFLSEELASFEASQKPSK